MATQTGKLTVALHITNSAGKTLVVPLAHEKETENNHKYSAAAALGVSAKEARGKTPGGVQVVAYLPIRPAGDVKAAATAAIEAMSEAELKALLAKLAKK